jgi:hypothetical protein
VVSRNCFARPTHTYLGFNAGRDFEKEIVVKVNVPEVLRAELRRPSWAREHVAMGTNTDPYQWVEGRYRLMPGIWEALRDARTPASVLTKSPLLLRDLALMQALGEVAEVSANLSVPTLDERAWRATEPHTPHPRTRSSTPAAPTRPRPSDSGCPGCCAARGRRRRRGSTATTIVGRRRPRRVRDRSRSACSDPRSKDPLR